MTDPDRYGVRAAIVYEPSSEQRRDGPPLNVLEIDWDDQFFEYFDSGDSRYLFPEVVDADDERAARDC